MESVGRFKPDRLVYEWAARQMGVELPDCMLVAAHGWDVAGAQWAGMRSAFVAREGQQKFPLAEAPEIDVPHWPHWPESSGCEPMQSAPLRQPGRERAAHCSSDHQRSIRGPRMAPSAPVSTMPSVYQAATKAAEASGQASE